MSYFSEISPLQAQSLIMTDNPLIIDVRDPHSYKEQHIDGAMRGHEQLTEHLINSGQFERPVLVYCYHGNSSKDMAAILGRAGFKRCYSLQGGFTAWKKLSGAGDASLIQAARSGDLTMVRQLLQSGTNLEACDGSGNTALWAACYGDHLTLMHELLQAGANIDHQNPDGVSVLMYAASAGKTDAVELLVEAGASLDLTNHDDYSALDLASNIEILRYLKSQSATA